MPSKTTTTQDTVTSTEVRTLLSKAAQALSSREEKALRARHGASLDLNEPLPRRGQEHPDAKAELLALEIELRAQLAARAQTTAAAAPQASREKDKIVRALRRLK